MESYVQISSNDAVLMLFDGKYEELWFKEYVTNSICQCKWHTIEIRDLFNTTFFIKNVVESSK